MRERLRGSSLLFALCAVLGCSADADKTGRGSEQGEGLGSQPPGAGTSGGAAAGAGGDDFGNADQPTPPSSSAGGGAPMPRPVMMGECAAVSQTAQNRLQPADIIFGIDTSGSMDEEAVFVQQNMNTFSQQIIDSGIDVRVILVAQQVPSMDSGNMGGFFGGGDDDDDFGICIDAPLGSGSCPADSNPPIYTHVNQEVRSSDVLGVLIGAYPSYRDVLREGSLKTFVSVTDDDATDPPISSAHGFIAAVDGLEPGSAMWSDWRYSSIYCFTDCEDAAEIGAVHADLVAETGGVGGDLCLQDFAPVFDELARQVVEGVQLACDWEIPDPPSGQTFDDTKTNVQLMLDGAPSLLSKAPSPADCGDRAGWYYDDEDAPNRVHACPSTCAQIQAASEANVDILFGCDTEVLE